MPSRPGSGRKPVGDVIHIHLEPEIERQIRQIAHDRKTQVSPLLRQVIKQWLESEVGNA